MRRQLSEYFALSVGMTITGFGLGKVSSLLGFDVAGLLSAIVSSFAALLGEVF